MNNELNKKLAEWAGFEIHLTGTPTGRPEMWRTRTEGKYANCGWIDFTESLDACFKWLEPKLGNYSLCKCREPRTTNFGTHYAQVWGHLSIAAYGEAYDKDPALALCLAIEKLIDGAPSA